MAAKNIIKIYAEADSNERVDIICKYYPSFVGIIDGYTEGLRYRIENEKSYNRKSAIGDLGVRVQSKGHYSDPTAKAATDNAEIVRAIKECDFSEGILEDVDSKEIIQSRAAVLKEMRDDFKLFNSQKNGLMPDEKKFFEVYLNDRPKLMDLAEEYGMQYESVGQRCRRLKERIKFQMVEFINGDI